MDSKRSFACRVAYRIAAGRLLGKRAEIAAKASYNTKSGASRNRSRQSAESARAGTVFHSGTNLSIGWDSSCKVESDESEWGDAGDLEQGKKTAVSYVAQSRHESRSHYQS